MIDPDAEQGRLPLHTGRQQSANEHEHEQLDHISTSSDTSSDDDIDLRQKSSEYDGHRPSLRETRSRSRTNDSFASQKRTRTRHESTATAATTGLERTISRRDTILSAIRSRPAVNKFTHPLSHVKTSKADLVDFDGPDDPYHPLNWPLKKKIITTGVYGMVTMTATYASSAYSAGTRAVAQEFGVGTQTATLGTTLFLFGFGLGPLLWAPLSEIYGRRLAVMIPMFVGICFSFGTAVAKDLQTVMLTRFFGAFFASAPVTNTGGVLGDMFTADRRGYAMAGYAMAVVAGPVLGPIVSAAVVQEPSLGWRWTEYLTGILQAVVLTIAVILIDESYPPKLLVYKARRLRHETGNWALHAKFEEWDVSLKEMARKFLVRPIQLLMTPICFLVALYASFCYGILYMQLGGIPIIFGEKRGWNPLVAVLPFVCILIGAVLGSLINVWNQKRYNKAFRAASNRPVPEQRLPAMMIGSVLFSGSQFLVGWTGPRTDIHWIVPCIGLVLLGCGFFTIFQASLNYLVDTFTLYAASAVAANTFLRSVFAGAFPLVVGPLYHNIGVGPGSSITGGFAALLIPVPFVFYIYGKRIRAKYEWSKPSVYD